MTDQPIITTAVLLVSVTVSIYVVLVAYQANESWGRRSVAIASQVIEKPLKRRPSSLCLSVDYEMELFML